MDVFFRTLVRADHTAWQMGKRPAARQGSPLWVTTAELPTSAGHPFFEREPTMTVLLGEPRQQVLDLAGR